MDKSSIQFSRNTSPIRQRELRDMFGDMRDAHPHKYLGLPTIIGRSKNVVFKEIKSRLLRKLGGWKEKLLSYMGREGREVLIKSVAQALLTDVMSCFLLPKCLCHEMEGLIRRFWWGQRGDETKMSWVGWKSLCMSKIRGGMGFSRPSCIQFNWHFWQNRVGSLHTTHIPWFIKSTRPNISPQVTYCNLNSATTLPLRGEAFGLLWKW